MVGPRISPETLRHRFEFGERLRELRGQAELTQAEVAERAGLEPSFYRKLENARHSVLVDRVWDLAAALEVPPSALFEPPGTSSGRTAKPEP